jgi:thioredoxin 1
MSISVQDGRLINTINSAGNKLVAVDFMATTCGPCRMIHPYWESLVSSYPKVVFCTVDVSECPTEANEYHIKSTPTFVFFLKGREVERFSGADKSRIKATIDRLKDQGAFSGSGRTLGDGPAPNQVGWLEQLERQRHQREASAAAPKPPSEVQHPPAPAPPPSAPAPTPLAAVSVTPPAPAAAVEVPEALAEELRAMGFSEDVIRRSYVGSGQGDLDACTDWIEEHQDDPEAAPPALPPPAAAPPPDDAPAWLAECRDRPLDEAGEKVLAQFLDMGFNAEFARIAINHSGASQTDACIEIINMLVRGDIASIPPPKKRLTLEEIEARKAKLRQAEAAKLDPVTLAKAELDRRKQVQDQIEAKKKFDALKGEQERRALERERLQAKLERERVLKKIQESRQKPAAASSAAAAPAAAPPPQRVPGETTLRLNLPNGTAKVAKFASTDKLRAVDTWVHREVQELARHTLGYEVPFPRQVLKPADFDKTLTDLGLAGRAQLTVKLLS